MAVVDLRRVTLCAADSLTPALTIAAMKRSLRGCDFADAVLFTDGALPATDGIRVVAIDKLASLDDYSRFILRRLAEHIETDHALVMQWDGFVVSPSAWKKEFLACDYIGARWPWHRDGRSVGNGGFSLRSRKLLEIGARRLELVPQVPEDELICRLYREALVANDGIVFASDALADAFSYERRPSTAATFGFHGIFNLWRHLNDEDMIALAEHLAPGTLKRSEYFELMINCYMQHRFAALKALYRRLRTFQSTDELIARMTATRNNAAVVVKFVALCEEAYGAPRGAGPSATGKISVPAQGVSPQLPAGAYSSRDSTTSADESNVPLSALSRRTLR